MEKNLISGKSKTVKIKFTNGASMSLILTDYITKHKGVLRLNGIQISQKNPLIATFMTKDFEGITKEDVINSAIEYLKSQTNEEFEIIENTNDF